MATQIWFRVLICFLAGAGAGIGTGFAGMSAAAIISPVLHTFLDIPAYQAIGIGLMSDVLASAISAWVYKKHGNLDVKNALILLALVLFMTVVGSYTASFLPDRTMGSFTQIGLLLVGLKFLLSPEKKMKESNSEDTKKTLLIKTIIGGTIVGFICGFVGAGGGMMLLLVLTAFLGYEMHIAVGTSVFIMAFTALIGGTSHFIVGGIPDVTCLVLCILFTLIWARIAAAIANKISAKTLSRSAGAVMVIASVIVLIYANV